MVGFCRKLELVRRLHKGGWEELMRPDHLSMYTYTMEMGVYVTDQRMKRVRLLANKLQARGQMNRRLVPVGI